MLCFIHVPVNKIAKLFTQQVSLLLFFFIVISLAFKYESNLVLLFPLFEMDLTI